MSKKKKPIGTFLLLNCTITDRKVIKHTDRIDVSTQDNMKDGGEFITNKTKEEKLIIELEFASDGRTKKITDEQIYQTIFAKLETISGVKYCDCNTALRGVDFVNQSICCIMCKKPIEIYEKNKK